MCRDGMGRVGYVPSWLCAEFALCRVDPAPYPVWLGIYKPYTVDSRYLDLAYLE